MNQKVQDKLSAYDKAIKAFQEQEPELFNERVWRYQKFMNDNMTLLKQKMASLQMMQKRVMAWENGKQISKIKWAPESVRVRDEIQKQMDKVYSIAEEQFFKGYEHLKPAVEEEDE